MNFSLYTSSLYFCLYFYIIQYVSGNVFLYNLLKKYIQAKVYLLMLLSVTSELINRSLINAYAVSLSGNVIYVIVGPYSSNRSHQSSTLSIVKLFYTKFYDLYIILYGTIIECYGIILGFTLYLTVLFIYLYN